MTPLLLLRQVLKEERENQRMIEQDRMRKAASLASGGGTVRSAGTMMYDPDSADNFGKKLAALPGKLIRMLGIKRGQVTAEDLIESARKKKEDKKEDKSGDATSIRGKLRLAHSTQKLTHNLQTLNTRRKTTGTSSTARSLAPLSWLQSRRQALPWRWPALPWALQRS